MARLAADGIFSFSLAPLRLGLIVGMTFLLLGFAEVLYLLGFWVLGRQEELIPGWSSTIMLITFASAAIMILLGFIGVYVGMIFQEVKRRPVFIVRSSSTGGKPTARSSVSEMLGSQ